MVRLAMNLWNKQYQKSGLRAKRLYPNEELLRFMAGIILTPRHHGGKRSRYESWIRGEILVYVERRI